MQVRELHPWNVDAAEARRQTTYATALFGLIRTFSPVACLL